MLIINSAIFLFVISISALVIPSILPMTTFLGVILLFSGLLLSIYRLGSVDNKLKIEFLENIHYGNIFLPVCCLLLLFFLFWSRLYYVEPFSFIPGFANLVLHVLFLVFIINTRDYLLIYLKSYIYFVLLMLAAGLAANFGVVEPYANFVNITALTQGAFTRDITMGDSYIFPYNLGFILISSGKLNLLGFEFFRISGWAHEPTSATLFVAPAMILLLHTKIIENLFTRLTVLGVIAAFWFFSMSLGSFLAFIILYFFYIIVILFNKVFPLKLTILLVAGLFFTILLASLYSNELLNSSLLYTKLNIGSQTFQAALDRLTWFLPDKTLGQGVSFSLMCIYAVIFFFLTTIFYSFSTQRDLSPYALILLYIVIHSMKGSQDTVFTHTFTWFWFYVLYYSLSTKPRSVQ